MPKVFSRNYAEDRILRSIQRKADQSKARDCDSLAIPAAIRYEKRQLSEQERSREFVRDRKLLAEYCCIHGVPYMFSGTRNGCAHCGTRKAPVYKPDIIGAFAALFSDDGA